MGIGKYITILIFAVSAAAFAVTCTDKFLSKTRARRVPEKWFIIMSVLGGGLGVLAAFYLVRHKTQHKKLLITVWTVSIMAYAGYICASVFITIS